MILPVLDLFVLSMLERGAQSPSVPSLRTYPRLKHHGKEKVVQQKHQDPKVQDLGSKWKIVYWD